MADRLSALQALLAAGRVNASGAAPDASATKIPLASGDLCAGEAATEVDPMAASLLIRLISRLPTGGQRPLSVQFLPCCAAEQAGSIAHSVARAATILLGRTLLLDALPHPRSETAADVHEAPLPDAFLPGLYHRRIGAAWSGLAVKRGPDLLASHAGESGRFRFIVLNAPAPSIGGPALALAPLCGGSVLVVQAGVTRLAAIRAAASDLTASGAHLLGTILFHPPGARA